MNYFNSWVDVQHPSPSWWWKILDTNPPASKKGGKEFDINRCENHPLYIEYCFLFPQWFPVMHTGIAYG